MFCKMFINGFDIIKRYNFFVRKLKKYGYFWYLLNRVGRVFSDKEWIFLYRLRFWFLKDIGNILNDLFILY